MKITSRFYGLKETQAAINKRKLAVRNVSPQALADVALDLLGRSVAMAPISPLGTDSRGDLRGSAYARVNNVTVGAGNASGGANTRGNPQPASHVTGETGYSVSYALRQHEEFPVKTDPTAQWKFLETPFAQNEQKYRNHLNDSLGKAVEDG